MILKYENGVSPLHGKQNGAVFQKYASGYQMLSIKRNGRKRYPKQWNSSGILIQLTGGWRNLSPAEQTAWNNWALNNPHPTHYNSILVSEEDFILIEEDSDSILIEEGPVWSGYTFYTVRNYYEQLFKGRNSPIFIPPSTVPVGNFIPEFHVYVYFGIVTLVISSSDALNSWLHGFFLTAVNSPGMKFPSTTPVYLTSYIPPSAPLLFTKTIDLTIPYYQNYGTVPHVGDNIFLKYVCVGKNTGNVFPVRFYNLQFEAP